MGKFNFQHIIDNFEKAKEELPEVLAKEAQDYFADSFKHQGWDGKGWHEVQRRIPGTKAYKYPKNKGLDRRTRPILTGTTGALRRAVSSVADNAEVSRQRHGFKVRLFIDPSAVPYANAQNSGTDRIPQRKFMGDSPELTKKLTKQVLKYFIKAWQE